MGALTAVVSRLPRSWISFIGRLQWKHPLLKHLFNRLAERFRNQDQTIQRGAGKGLRFNTGTTNAGYILGTTEPDTQKALELLVKPGMTIYDVGANVGFLTIIAARLIGPEGCVVCFEPQSENVRRLQHNASLNGFGQIMIRREALGAIDGEAEFCFSSEPGWGKLAKFGAPGQEVRREQVAIRRLDSVTPELRPPQLIKIDVEGAETDVLKGGAETLRTHRPLLLIELHKTNESVADLLLEMKYRCHALGSTSDVRTLPWDTKLLAIPIERDDLASAVQVIMRSTR